MTLLEDLKDTRNFKTMIIADIEKRIMSIEINLDALKMDLVREHKRLDKLKAFSSCSKGR